MNTDKIALFNYLIIIELLLIFQLTITRQLLFRFSTKTGRLIEKKYKTFRLIFNLAFKYNFQNISNILSKITHLKISAKSVEI